MTQTALACRPYTKGQARRDRAQATMGRIAGIAFHVEEVTYTVDPKTGDRVRDQNPRDRDAMRNFLLNRRGFDRAELEEEMGRGWEAYMVRVGYVVPAGPAIYALTEKAAATYRLPAKINGLKARYAKTPEGKEKAK